MMNKSDISTIKIGTKTWTKKWWQEKRAILANGSGMGKALDDWAKHCPDDPETIPEVDQAQARKAAWDVMQAALTGKKKCGKLAKDTAAACDRYYELAAEYREKIGLKATGNSPNRDSIGEAQKKDTIRRLDFARDELLKIGKSTIGECEKKIEALEKAKSTGKLLTAQAKALATGAAKLSRTDIERGVEGLETLRNQLGKFLQNDLKPTWRAQKELHNLIEKAKDKKLVAPYKKAFVEIQPLADMSSDLEMGIQDIEELKEDIAFALSGSERSEEQALKEMDYCVKRVYGNPTYPLDAFPDRVKLNILEPARSLIKRRGETLDEKGEGEVSQAFTLIEAAMMEARQASGVCNRSVAKIVKVTEGRTGHPEVKPVLIKAASEMKAMKKALEDGEKHYKAAKLVAEELLA